MSEPRVITITIHGPNQFDVTEGERTSDHLCWDEMLGQIAHLTHSKIGEPRYSMLTEEQRAAEDERHKVRMDAVHAANAILGMKEPAQ